MTDFSELELELELKIAILMGIFSAWGDGEVSAEEIKMIRQYISKISSFNPAGIVHRDINDSYLVLDEKVAWVLDTVKTTLLSAASLSRVEKLEVVKGVSGEIYEDVMEISPSRVEAEKTISELKKFFEKLIAVDGTITSDEKQLLKAFSKGATSFDWTDPKNILLLISLIGINAAGIWYFFYR